MIHLCEISRRGKSKEVKYIGGFLGLVRMKERDVTGKQHKISLGLMKIL